MPAGGAVHKIYKQWVESVLGRGTLLKDSHLQAAVQVGGGESDTAPHLLLAVRGRSGTRKPTSDRHSDLGLSVHGHIPDKRLGTALMTAQHPRGHTWGGEWG